MVGGREISVALVHCVSAFIDMVICVGAFLHCFVARACFDAEPDFKNRFASNVFLYDVIFYGHVHKYSSQLVRGSVFFAIITKFYIFQY